MLRTPISNVRLFGHSLHWHGSCIKEAAHECTRVHSCLYDNQFEHLLYMKKFKGLVVIAGIAAVLGLTGSKALAQGRGNFDPEQMKQRMMDRYKERLEVKSDDEWKIISERIEKVMTAQRDARIASFGGFGGGGRRGGGGDNAGGGDTNAANR